MKNITTYINESRASDVASKNADKLLIKYHSKNALELKNKLEANKWIFDTNYNDWNAGEDVTFRFTKDSEKFFVTYSLNKNSKYNGNITDNELEKLTLIDTAEYYKK